VQTSGAAVAVDGNSDGVCQSQRWQLPGAAVAAVRSSGDGYQGQQWQRVVLAAVRSSGESCQGQRTTVETMSLTYNRTCGYTVLVVPFGGQNCLLSSIHIA
jgi:hypothetical protein